MKMSAKYQLNYSNKYKQYAKNVVSETTAEACFHCIIKTEKGGNEK
jgi:hypothetical protein